MRQALVMGGLQSPGFENLRRAHCLFITLKQTPVSHTIVLVLAASLQCSVTFLHSRTQSQGGHRRYVANGKGKYLGENW